MIRFLIKIVVFLVCVLCVDVLLHRCMQSFRPADYAAFIDSKDAIHEVGNDIKTLFIGDSQAADGFDPRIFERDGAAAFNFGIHYASLKDQAHLLRYLLKRVTPQVDTVVLMNNPTLFNRPNTPGYYTPIFLDHLLDRWRYFSSYDALGMEVIFATKRESQLVGTMWKALRGIAPEPISAGEQIYHGYRAREDRFSDHGELSQGPVHGKSLVNPVQVNALEALVTHLQDRNIRIIFAFAPMHDELLQRYQQTKAYHHNQKALAVIAKKFDIPMFNMDNRDLRGKIEDDAFADQLHLNRDGAQIFSRALARWMVKAVP